MIKDIPCKECLVLPMCRNKKELECSMLYDWVGDDLKTTNELIDMFPNKATLMGKSIILENGEGGYKIRFLYANSEPILKLKTVR